MSHKNTLQESSFIDITRQAYENIIYRGEEKNREIREKADAE